MADGHLNFCKECKKIYQNYRRRGTDRTSEWKGTTPTTRARVAKYRARKKDQTCACCTKEDFELVYLLSSLGESQYEVDHIVPIAAGGVHCTSNLQILTKTENRVKGFSNRTGY